MKKVLIAALATTSLVSTANAGSINLDMRADYASQNFNQEANSANTAKYYFKTLRVNYEGQVNETLSFRLRAAYNKAATPVAGAGDNGVTALEFAYLNHKMSDELSLQFGRLNSDHGGIEAATASTDLYLTSQAYNGSGVGTNGAVTKKWFSSNELLYVTGAKLTYTFMADNSLSLSSFKAPTSATAEQNAMMTGLSYKGAFMEKSLKVMANYHMGNGTTNSADKYENMALGVGYSMDPVAVSVDYVVNAFKDDASGNKDQISSIVGKLAYTGLEQWTPRLEVVSTENKVEIGTSKTDKFMGYGAVMEFRPYADYEKFRYHVAYHMWEADMENPALAGKPNVQEITIGARLYADFLK